MKQSKTLPEVFVDKELYTSQEIVASAFNPADERLLVTLTGDLNLILWQWESGQYLANKEIQMSVVKDSLLPYQVSYKPHGHDSQSILVTGPSTFVYFKVKTRKKKEDDGMMKVEGENNKEKKKKKDEDEKKESTTPLEFETVHS